MDVNDVGSSDVSTELAATQPDSVPTLLPGTPALSVNIETLRLKVGLPVFTSGKMAAHTVLEPLTKLATNCVAIHKRIELFPIRTVVELAWSSCCIRTSQAIYSEPTFP